MTVSRFINSILQINYSQLIFKSTVLWAQRSNKTEAAKNFIYLTISVPDVQPSNLKLDLKPQSLSFAGHSDSLKRDYQVSLEFYDEIDVAETKINHTAKNVEVVLRKKELKEEFWPRLLKDAKKVHFLKTDFDKWVDEDEQDEAPEDDLGMCFTKFPFAHLRTQPRGYANLISRKHGRNGRYARNG